MRQYPTATDAEKAGYVRYTGEDETGAISYANVRQWQSSDIRHPSQLWYDKNGLLLGADYSVLVRTNPSRPRLWGVNAGRWVELDGHVHWVAKNPATGQTTYDHWATDDAFSAAGGNPERPGVGTLVAMKKVAGARDVVTIFHFPSIWDLIVWVKPNPKGAFAESNPLVTPSRHLTVGVVERAALGAFVELDVVEEIVDDLAIVEADFGERSPADLDDFVHVARSPGVRIVHVGVVRISRFRAGRRLHSAQRRAVLVHESEVRRALLRSIAHDR